MAITEAQYREIIGAQNAAALNPDDKFPGSSGDRERGKFRQGPAGMPRLTAVAVVGPDGTEIGTALVPSFGELVHEIRQLRKSLVLAEVAVDLGDL